MSGTIQVFFLVLALSFLFSTLVTRVPWLRIPSAVSYLLFGVLLQTHAVELGQEEIRWLTELGNVGLLFLMFLSGLEIDVSLLRPESWRSSQVNPMFTAGYIFLSTLLASYAVSFAVVRILPESANIWMLTLLFATTSLGIILPILEETGVLKQEYGQILLLSALVADMSTMILISLFISARTNGQLGSLLVAMIVVPLAVVVYLAIRFAQKSAYARSFAGDAQHRMRGVIALVAVFCATADFTGSEPIIGSFLVGITVASVPFAFKSTLKQYFHGIGYGFLIPVFFMAVGLNFDYRILAQPSAWIWVPVLFTAAILVKVIPTWYLHRYYGRRKALAAGILLSARLSLIIAVADIGVRIGALPELLSESVIIVAVLTSVLAPVAFVSIL